MKQSYTTKLTALIILLFSCFTTANAAYRIDIDGITYYISDNASTGATVDYKLDGTQYSGDIVIPDEIVVDGTTYNVKGLADPYVFYSCPELTSFTSGVNFNPFNSEYYFSYSYNLKSVTFNYTPYNRKGALAYPRNAILGSFNYCSSLESITFPSKMKDASTTITFIDQAFYACTSLKAINKLPTNAGYIIGSYTFGNCKAFNPLEFIDLSKIRFQSSSDPYSEVIENSFLSCNISSVTIPDNWTTIPYGIFAGCPLTEVIIPSSVTHIEDRAFYSYSFPVATPTLHEGLISLGSNAYYGIENLNIPSTLQILKAPYYSYELKSITVADGNKFFSVKNNALYENLYEYVTEDSLNFTGEKCLRNVIAGNGYTGPSIWKEDESVTEIASYAFYHIPVTNYDIPNLNIIGDWAFEGSSIEKVNIKKDIKYGEGAFSLCQELKDVTIEDGVKTLPYAIFSGCKNLTIAPSLPNSLTTLNNGMEFRDCGFTSVRLHPAFESLYHGTFSRNVTNIECMSILPPAITNFSNNPDDGWNRMYMPDITLTVPQGSVELYKQHEIWGQCKEIIGNPNWKGFGAVTELPSGLWFAKKGGNICYYNNGYHDTGIPAGNHPFQMQIHNNALYVADAGASHYYSSNGGEYGTGDGQLYKVEYIDNSFVKVPMIVSGGEGCDFADPYTCFIDKSNGDIYTANRNQGVYKFNIADKNWYTEKLNTLQDTYNNGDYGISTVSYFVRNNWLDYYNAGISYGAIPRDFQRDSNGVNWLLYNYNGYGIYRFRDSDIHSDGNINIRNNPFGRVFEGSTFSSMYIDETNGYLYVFLTIPLSSQGLYRIALSNISDTNNTPFKNMELIDASPASSEYTLSFEEGVYVRQITGDGKYIYWSYIAEEGSGHSSGIKMIPATGTPTVSYLIKDVEVYGFAMKDFNPSGIEDVIADGIAPKLINVAGNRISAIEDVNITVYSLSGAIETTIDIATGETIVLDNLSRGVHIIRATATDGTTATLKTVL